MEETLQELGLSNHAVEVYLALLEVGQTSVGKLIEATQLHPQLIYNALAELEKDDLATNLVQRGRKYFRAGSPKKLQEIARVRLEKVTEGLPGLLAKYQKSGSHSVQVVSGEAEFRRARLALIRAIPREGDYFIIGSGGRLFMQAMEGTYHETELIRLRRKVKKWLIGFADVAAYEEAYRENAPLEKRRYLTDHYESPTTTIFGGSRLMLIVWQQPIVTVIIENKDLVKSYQAYFHLLWRQAVDVSELSQQKRVKSLDKKRNS